MRKISSVEENNNLI